MEKSFSFKIISKDKKSHARLGRITTPHGIVETPAFVSVGTQGSVKGLSPKDFKEIGVQIIFGNTYHLHLRPGEEIISKLGGLGKFMSWGGPTITDSGGFQVFSLGQKKTVLFGDDEKTEVNIVSITEDGVRFRSHIDGSSHLFTPEKSILIQKKLGADIILVFDECAPHPSTYDYTKEAMERTHNWALRCLKSFSSPSEESRSLPRHLGGDRLKRSGHDSSEVNPQALYGIIQGGVYKDLRKKSAKFICEQKFDGIAIGGVSVGESKKEMRDVLEWVYPYLPENKPRHLLGIGEIDDIFDAIDEGMDTFDCVIPTRFGRYGIVFISPPEGNIINRFRLAISKTTYVTDKSPLDKNCKCYVCQSFTKAYIHHLFKANELLAYRLASYHNTFFITDLMRQIRKAMAEGSLEKLKKEWFS